MGMSRADNSVKFNEICPLAIPNQISLMSMHIASLVKIPCYLLKLLSGKENLGVWADNSVKIWRNLPISNPKPDIHNINAHTKFGENPLLFTRYHPETKDGRMYNWWTDRHTDIKRETIIPCHYWVAWFKNHICGTFWTDTAVPENLILFFLALTDNFIKFWTIGPRPIAYFIASGEMNVHLK